MNNHLISPNTALVNFFISGAKTLILLIRKDFDKPLVFEAELQRSEFLALALEYLRLCAQRLIVDFNGLPTDWRKISSADSVTKCLKLAPEIKPHRRLSVPYYPTPILQDAELRAEYKFELTYMEELSEALLPAEFKDAIKDCDLLCFAPHGPLHALPLHALNWSKNEYLIDKFGICYTPSVSVLKYCQDKNPIRRSLKHHKPKRCLVACVGAKENRPSDFEQDVNFFKFSGSDLTPLLGPNATKEEVTRNMAYQDIIHLACHGIFAGDIGGDVLDSGLMLFDRGPSRSLSSLSSAPLEERMKFFLTAREIFNLNLHADLVTLRACSSGRSQVTTGDDLIGLSRAFLYAGTPSLLVTLWNVDIKSSYKLLKEFYRLWLDESHPLPKWKALQTAQISLLKDPERQDYHHPYHWAPLILIGDWL